MSISQQKLADHLGISRKSVTRALSGKAKVSEATRLRVLETARELGYDEGSNADARNLVARRNGNRIRHGVIGFCMSAELCRSFHFWGRMLEGVRRAASEAGVEVMFLETQGTPALSKVDGFIGAGIGAYLPPDHALHSMPRVAVVTEFEGIPSVLMDDFGGAKAATDFLIELGHRRIAYLIDANADNPQSLRRVNGYAEALRAAGICADERWIGPLHLGAGEFLGRGRDSMNAWLADGWKELGCTALMVQNDRAAIGACEALQAAGIRIPEELSVVGFDDTLECEIVKPSLTSVRVPLEEIGAEAVKILLRQINEEFCSTDSIVMPVKLEARNSTAPPCN